MRTYRIKKCFAIAYDHTIIYFNANSIWEEVEERNGYIKINRKNVFVDVTKAQIREYMVEVKEQKGKTE